MTTSELLAELDQRDIRLSVKGGKLLIDAPERSLTALLRSELADHKQELIRVIQEPDDLEAANERRGVLSPSSLAFSDGQASEKERGVRPAHYRYTSDCKRCGPIWVPDVKEIYEPRNECPWCYNRQNGLPIPSRL